jgi:hypothetical protein
MENRILKKAKDITIEILDFSVTSVAVLAVTLGPLFAFLASMDEEDRKKYINESQPKHRKEIQEKQKLWFGKIYQILQNTKSEEITKLKRKEVYGVSVSLSENSELESLGLQKIEVIRLPESRFTFSDFVLVLTDVEGKKKNFYGNLEWFKN